MKKYTWEDGFKPKGKQIKKKFHPVYKSSVQALEGGLKPGEKFRKGVLQLDGYTYIKYVECKVAPLPFKGSLTGGYLTKEEIVAAKVYYKIKGEYWLLSEEDPRFPKGRVIFGGDEINYIEFEVPMTTSDFKMDVIWKAP